VFAHRPGHSVLVIVHLGRAQAQGGFCVDDYLTQCDEFGGGVENLPMWDALRTLLGPRRNGWRFEIINPSIAPSAAWCFGLAGAARLVVTVEDGQILLYVHELDEEYRFSAVNELASWLDQHEAAYEGFTPLQREILGDYLPRQVDRWRDEQS
jgi:hypothetical protein